MSLVPFVERESATGIVRDQLDLIHAAFGTVPAMFRAVANSPAALTSMWAAFGAFGGGALGSALSEQIAVAVANRNSCEYCLAAHTALGRKAGVSPAALRAAQTGDSDDPRTAALLGFALKLVEERGQVTPADVQALRDEGWSDEHIVEVIGQVALNLFTNYINIALAVPVDFPTVGLRQADGASAR
ncbi:carboxymuconolactone decarboxylase family protein [Nocardia huaxiensis]|uniref:Peroxidase-related enzyme n=1 Tax=Nocardia huaxiensis TaxID=2755382 RepID=A0A7D6VDA7_9NOCA|nr:peroxidase-related enzyme [Nocardia huaxiensis]QLY32531.1 peroxidase-related enzyme [Nocardia huaxiensis]UFS93757.1 peroxidase-related enzyme [Nocardia huaxiensis]